MFNDATDDSFRNAVSVMPLFARSVAAELREASDQVGEPCHYLHSLEAQTASLSSLVYQPHSTSAPVRPDQGLAFRIAANVALC